MKSIFKLIATLLCLISSSIAYGQTGQTWNIKDVNLQTINTSPSPFRFYGGNTLLTTYDGGQRLSGAGFGLALPNFQSSQDIYWLGAYRPQGSSNGNAGSNVIDANGVWLHPGSNLRVRARFIAPSSGQYSFSGAFQHGNTAITTGVQVIYNSQTVTLSAPYQRQNFSFNRTLVAGQTVDFEVDAMGNMSNDGTNLFLTVSYTAPTEWQTGQWGPWSNECSANATRTRSVVCMQGQTVVADNQCTATKPQTSETTGIYSTCTYEAIYTPIGTWSECANSQQSRQQEVTCQRSDGTPAELTRCSIDSDELSIIQTETQSCLNKALWATGDWSEWSTQCGPATRTRAIVCQRDGSPVTNDQCTDPEPNGSESSEIYAGCTYSMRTVSQGAWSTCQNGLQSRVISRVCERSDEMIAEVSQCGETQTEFQQTQTCVDEPTGGSSSGGNDSSSGGNNGGGVVSPPVIQQDDVVVFRRKLTKDK